MRVKTKKSMKEEAKDYLKNGKLTIKPELAELDGNVIFADKIKRAKETLERVGLPKQLKKK
jgi:hypothetical protein